MLTIQTKAKLIDWFEEQFLVREPTVQINAGFVRQFIDHTNITRAQGYLPLPEEDPATYWLFLMKDLSSPGPDVSCHAGLFEMTFQLISSMTIPALATKIEYEDFFAMAVDELGLEDKIFTSEVDGLISIRSRSLPGVSIRVSFVKRKRRAPPSEAIEELRGMRGRSRRRRPYDGLLYFGPGSEWVEVE